MAIIIGHIIPFDGCNQDFGVRLRAILERYQHLIRLSLFGHYHNDMFNIAMSYSQPERPVGSLTVCGALTTWGGNPVFCVYEVDAETLLPVERRTYAFDLATANQQGTINWYQLTDWRSTYKLDDLSPSSLLALAQRIGSKSDTAQKFICHSRRQVKEECECDEKC